MAGYPVRLRGRDLVTSLTVPRERKASDSEFQTHDLVSHLQVRTLQDFLSMLIPSAPDMSTTVPGGDGFISAERALDVYLVCLRDSHRDRDHRDTRLRYGEHPSARQSAILYTE